MIPMTEEGNMTDRVFVVSRSGMVPYSGYLRTWIALRVRRSDGNASELYLPYFFENQFIPPEGSACTVRFHTKVGDGVTSEMSLDGLDQMNAVDAISCDTGSFRMPLFTVPLLPTH
jgi:hypothetical protein